MDINSPIPPAYCKHGLLACSEAMSSDSWELQGVLVQVIY